MPSDNDIRSWHTAMADVKPLKKRAQQMRVLSPEELAKKPIKSKPAFVTRAAARSGFDAKIDLHGMTEAAAHRALMDFVTGGIERGSRRLLVITGKGSAGGGALRTNVPRWLDVAGTAEHISGVDSAPVQLGGEGAYLVRLKKPQ